MNFNHHQSHHTGNNNPTTNLGKHRAYQQQQQQSQSQLHQQQLIQQQQQQFPQQLSPPFQPQQQQLPFKTYLLNKYGQYQNSPSSQLIEPDDPTTSAGVLQGVISVGSAADNLYESVLKAPAGHNTSIFNSISSHLNNESGFIGAGSSNSLLKHHQSNYISKFAPLQTSSSSLAASLNQQQHQQQQQQQSLIQQTSNGLVVSAANPSISSQLINLLELNSQPTDTSAKTSKKPGKKSPAKKTTPEKIELVIKESLGQVAAALPGAKSKSQSSNLLKETSLLDSNLDAMATSSKRKYSGSNSSLQNSDEDDDLDESFSGLPGGKSKEEKRRLSHTAAEQKRRNAIKRGYDDLQSIVPACEYMDPSSSQKACKATVLKRSIDYIYELEKDKEKHEEEIESLKKEIMALRIMKTNYEEMVQYHRNMPKDENVEVNDETKFELFTKFADNLFHSFSTMVSTNSFAEMSSSILNWIEHSCSANNLRNLVYLSLVQIGQQILQ